MTSKFLNTKKRGYLLPPGCKDLIHVLQGPPPKPLFSAKARVNGKIRAREVRLIAQNGQDIGIFPTTVALRLARACKHDLVEIAPRAKPPVCRLVDFGKFSFELRRRLRNP